MEGLGSSATPGLMADSPAASLTCISSSRRLARCPTADPLAGKEAAAAKRCLAVLRQAADKSSFLPGGGGPGGGGEGGEGEGEEGEGGGGEVQCRVA